MRWARSFLIPQSMVGRLRVWPWSIAAGLFRSTVAPPTPIPSRPYALVAWESLGTFALEGREKSSDVTATSLASPSGGLSPSPLPSAPWRVPVHCTVQVLVSEHLLPCRSTPAYSRGQGTSLVMLWKLRSSLGVISLTNKGTQEWTQTEAPGIILLEFTRPPSPPLLGWTGSKSQ